jgi:hypothetical protein
MSEGTRFTLRAHPFGLEVYLEDGTAIAAVDFDTCAGKRGGERSVTCNVAEKERKAVPFGHVPRAKVNN